MRHALKLLFVSLWSVSFGVGCVQVRHQSVEETLYPCEPSPYLPAARNEVYLYMMNNGDLTEQGGLLTLRDHLAQYGFPKVYHAQKVDSAWYARELRRIHRDRPEARLLLLSYGNSASNILQLAQEAIQDQLPIDAVIFLDPFGLNEDLRNCLSVPSILIRSHNWQGSPNLVTSQTFMLDAVGHLSVARSQQLLQIMLGLMNASASGVPGATAHELPHLPLKLPKPVPRSEIVISTPPPQWSFLQRFPEFPTLPLVPESRHFENCPNGCPPSPR